MLKSEPLAFCGRRDKITYGGPKGVAEQRKQNQKSAAHTFLFLCLQMLKSEPLAFCGIKKAANAADFVFFVAGTGLEPATFGL